MTRCGSGCARWSRRERRRTASSDRFNLVGPVRCSTCSSAFAPARNRTSSSGIRPSPLRKRTERHWRPGSIQVAAGCHVDVELPSDAKVVPVLPIVSMASRTLLPFLPSVLQLVASLLVLTSLLQWVILPRVQRAARARTLRAGCGQAADLTVPRARASDQPSSPIRNAAMNASCGIWTEPYSRILSLPFFCLSNSLRLRVASPP